MLTYISFSRPNWCWHIHIDGYDKHFVFHFVPVSVVIAQHAGEHYLKSCTLIRRFSRTVTRDELSSIIRLVAMEAVLKLEGEVCICILSYIWTVQEKFGLM